MFSLEKQKKGKDNKDHCFYFLVKIFYKHIYAMLFLEKGKSKEKKLLFIYILRFICIYRKQHKER